MKTLQSEFLAAMSHELRTPLNSIIGYSEMMEENAREEKLTDYVENLEKVIDSGKRLLKLINDLFDVARLESGEMEVFAEDIKLKEFIKNLESEFRETGIKNKNSFGVDIKTDLKTIHSDATRLRQALLYLLSNADKFTSNGHIDLVVSAKGNQINFAVKDTGMGISREYIKQLFQKFSQGDASITRKYGGTGLGLYLTKHFCELLNGSITVESQEGKGSVFTISLPQQMAQVTEKSEQETETAKFAGKTALVVGYDQAAIKDIIQDVTKLGFEVLIGKTGPDGLMLARKHIPDVVVLDIAVAFTLGDTLMEQWLLLSELKSNPRLAKIPLVVTAKDATHESLGFVLGEVDFLSKPIDMGLLISKLKELVPTGESLLMVIDDDESAREIMSAAAKKVGWKSVEAENGLDGLQKLEKLGDELPALILLDLMMPEMDGFSFISELQQNEKWRRLPVVIVSAKELSQDELSMLKKYSRGILQKGAYSRQELITAISEQVK